MRFNIRQTERDFTKVVREEIGRDGYACIDSVNIAIVDSAKLITIKGHFGRDGKEKEHNFTEYYEIAYLDGKGREFVKGVFYKEMDILLG